MRKKIVTFEIEYRQILDENGDVDPELDPHLPEQDLKVMYHLMVLARTFDEKMYKLQRAGKIGTYAPIRGQEASNVGSGYPLQPDDWLVPSFRETGVFLTRGADRAKIIQVWKGDTRGYQDPKARHCLPVSIPIGSQALHACGIAWASKLRGEKECAITYFGDGGTSEGDVHEAMNFAGEFKLPVVFFVQDNQWAISTPRRKQTASETLAQKAIAYGFPGIQIDGNDIIGVYQTVKEALERGRRGEGPTFIEAMTYRMSDHTTSDDATKYRKDEEVKAWESKDPILRLRLHFQKRGWWNEEYGKWVQDECDKEVNEAVERALAIPPPPPEEVFNNIYARLPLDLEEQKRELIEEWANKGGA